MNLTIDFETRSEVDLIKTNVWTYASHPSTRVMCLAAKPDDGPAYLWLPKWILQKLTMDHLQQIFPESTNPMMRLLRNDQLAWLIDQAETVEAHYKHMEEAHWVYHMLKEGLPPVPQHKWRCSATKAAVMALPRSLEQVAHVVGAKELKSTDGSFLMRKMCKPRNPLKADIDYYNTICQPVPVLWHEEPDQIVGLCRYCIQDVKAEESASHEGLLPLSDDELKLWQCDQKINKRGVFVDEASIDVLIEAVDKYKEMIKLEFARLVNTPGFTSPDQRAMFIEHLAKVYGVNLKDTQKATVEKMMADPGLHPTALRLLQIQRCLAKKSVEKVVAFKNYICRDGRVRDILMHHGASTGRWAGKGPQLHNTPRDSYKPEQFEQFMATVRQNPMMVQEVMGDEFMAGVSKAIKGLITAAPGKDLMAADYSNIEGRILAWLAGDYHIVKAFEDFDRGIGHDPYKVEAAGIFGKPVEQIDGGEERQTGKVVQLACGYNGGWRAFMNMAEAYGLEPPQYPEHLMEEEDWLDYDGSKLTYRDACFKKWGSPIVKRWRDSRPNTVALWNGIENAAVDAIRNPGRKYSYEGVTFFIQQVGKLNYLVCKLPSGRNLYYCLPEIRKQRTAWGDFKDTITFMGVHSETKKWVRLATYGGKLVENCVQALARDIMGGGIINLEDAGYPVVFHVHDEVISEIPKGFGSLEEFSHILTILPSWAAGLPLKVGGWRAERYHKE